MFGIIKTTLFSLRFGLFCVTIACMELYLNIPDSIKLIFGLLIASILLNKQINWIANFQIKKFKNIA